MFVELAQFSLTLALAMALCGAVAPIVGAMRNNVPLMRFGSFATLMQFGLIIFAWCVLTRAFLGSDFSLRIVVENSHTLKPFLYKLSGVWGNHEGSLLLWILILTGFAATIAITGRTLPMRLHARVLGVQSLIAAAFLGFVIFTSNPFDRLVVPPFDGRGLNPLLQDPGLVFHPPFLYLGYVGLSVTFSFAIAALLEGHVDAAWGRWVRPWTLAAWIFLTIGIGLGSWWAYYELGWGGFWFWDPVENASFMPWLISVALLHSAVVVEKREALKAWTILLAILAFGFSLIGTFIVRSGVLTSVHAFANDPERGVYILLILMGFLGGGLVLFALRAAALQSRAIFAFISREGALVANNILLSIACFVVFVGTVWPLVAEFLMDRKLSVGPPFFNQALSPFIILLAIILPVGAAMPWKRANITTRMGRLWPYLALVFVVGCLIWAMQTQNSSAGPLGVALGLWVICAPVQEIWQRMAHSKNRLQSLKRMPLADWGKSLAHFGFGITMIAISAITVWEVEDITILTPGQTRNVAGYDITLRDVREVQGPNYISTMATIDVTHNGSLMGRIHPERRYYPVAQMPTTEAGILNGTWRDIYVVVGDPQDNGGWAVRSFIKPMANWIWGGAFLMALGGIISLIDRRYRTARGIGRKQGGAV